MADAVFALRRGHVYELGRATVAYVPDGAPLTFYVKDGEVVFVERMRGTWSDIIASRASR